MQIIYLKQLSLAVESNRYASRFCMEEVIETFEPSSACASPEARTTLHAPAVMERRTHRGSREGLRQSIRQEVCRRGITGLLGALHMIRSRFETQCRCNRDADMFAIVRGGDFVPAT